MTNPTNEQQAREIITAHSKHSVVVRQEQLVEAIQVALSSHDAEIREVLEGLAKSFDCAAWKGFNQSDSEFEKGYKHAMEVAARNVRECWSKLQPKESSDVTE